MFGFSLPWNRKKSKIQIPFKSADHFDFILTRSENGDEGTFGILSGPAYGFRCHMIELPWRDNRVNYSCIPVGTYKVRPYISHRFGRCFKVMDVPNRTAILIHPANLAGDREKGLSSQLRGCLAPGRLRCRLTGKTGKKQQAVGASRPALGDLIQAHGHRSFTLKIVEEF